MGRGRLESLLGVKPGGGKAKRPSAAGGSILQAAKEASARAKAAKRGGGNDDRSKNRGGVASTPPPRRDESRAAPKEPPPPQRASRWTEEEEEDEDDAPAPVRPAEKSRWGDDAASEDDDDDDDDDDDERHRARDAPAAEPAKPPAPESVAERAIREAMEFKIANLERDMMEADEDGEIPTADARGRPAAATKENLLDTPSDDGDGDDTPGRPAPREDDARAPPRGGNDEEDARAEPNPNDVDPDLDELDDAAAAAAAPPPRRRRSPSPSPLPASPTPSPSPSPPRGPRVFDTMAGCRSVFEYQQLNRIDEGTYGVVFRARDKNTGVVRALKKIKMEKEREGFPLTALREANILLSMQHPNIVDVTEMVVGHTLDSVFMVMEFADHDLKGLMETMSKPFSVPEVKCLMLQLLSGVSYLHDNWVLHRDLKTSNVLVNNRGELKICDFGLARQYSDPLRAYTRVVVTLWYRAPELLLGTKMYDTAIDVWSLGCIMGELLGKEPLFQGKTETDQVDRIFKLLGTPNEKIWPDFPSLPAAKKLTTARQQPYNQLRRKFPKISPNGGPCVSDLGFDLLNKLLAYDPKRRVTAEDASTHAFFAEHPPPKEKRDMPTYPSKASGEGYAAARRAAMKRDEDVARRAAMEADPLEAQRIREEAAAARGAGGGGLFSQF